MQRTFCALANVSDVDDAPAGLSCISSGGAGNPYNFWCTLITIRNATTSYAWQLAVPWAAGELEKSIKYRICDQRVWGDWFAL